MFPVKNKGNKSNKELTKAIYTRNISICCNGGRLRSLKLLNMIPLAALKNHVIIYANKRT